MGLDKGSSPLGLPGHPSQSGSGGGGGNASANNNVNIDVKNDLSVTSNYDEMAEATKESNQWFEIQANTQILNALSDIETNQEQLKLSKQTLLENRKNNKIMLSIAVVGLLIAYNKGGN